MGLLVIVAAALFVALVVSPVRFMGALLKLALFVMAAAAGVAIYLAGPEPLLITVVVVCGLGWVLLAVVPSGQRRNSR